MEQYLYSPFVMVSCLITHRGKLLYLYYLIDLLKPTFSKKSIRVFEQKSVFSVPQNYVTSGVYSGLRSAIDLCYKLGVLRST